MKDLNKINWIDVKSSQILGMYFSLEEKILYIRFRNRTIYAYEDFRLDDYIDFKNAESAGKHFHSIIKNDFVHKRLK